MDQEWGPWIEHDGRGCPVQDGILVTVCGYNTYGRWEEYTRPAKSTWLGWEWSNGPRIIRYRIRKPRALLDLIAIADDPYAVPPLPEAVPA